MEGACPVSIQAAQGRPMSLVVMVETLSARLDFNKKVAARMDQTTAVLVVQEVGDTTRQGAAFQHQESWRQGLKGEMAQRISEMEPVVEAALSQVRRGVLSAESGDQGAARLESMETMVPAEAEAARGVGKNCQLPLT